MSAQQHPTPKNLDAGAATKKIREIAKEARMCMMTTRVDSYPPDVRPMALQEVGDDGSLWFLSANDSDKNQDIARDPRVVITFQNDSDSQYLSVAGEATIHADRATIEKHWTPMASTWFDGKDDPRLTVLQIRPTDGHYWESDDGRMMTAAKFAFNAVTGKPTGRPIGTDGQLKP